MLKWRLSDRLRRLGFKIHSRPERGPVLWQRNGNVYTQEAALMIADRELAAVEKKK